MKQIRHYLWILGILSFLGVQGQSTAEQNRDQSVFKKSPSVLTKPDNSQLQMLALLRQAESTNTLSLAFEKLKSAKKICGVKSEATCQKALGISVEKVFQYWLNKTEKLGAERGQDQLEELRAVACTSGFGSWVNCQALNQLEQTWSNNQYEQIYEDYLEQARNAQNFEAQIARLDKAKEVCNQHLKNNCAQELKGLYKEAYKNEFQDIARGLRQSSGSYAQNLQNLGALEAMLAGPYMGPKERQQYDRLFYKTHEQQVQSLMNKRGSVSQRLANLDDAKVIDRSFLQSNYSQSIDELLIEVLDTEWDNLLQWRRGMDFRSQLRQYEKAANLVDEFPATERPARVNALQKHRRLILDQELERREAKLQRSTDWRRSLVGYEELLQFVRTYREDFPRSTSRQIQRARAGFIMGEYEARIQQSLQALAARDLIGAQQFLSGAVELSRTDFLPEGPARYRHREIYQRLYGAHHQVLENAKLNRQWDIAEARLVLIEQLLQEAPFVLLRASLAQERLDLDLARFSARLEDFQQVLRQQSVKNHLPGLASLLDDYRPLEVYADPQLKDRLNRVVLETTNLPLDLARQALERKDYLGVYPYLTELHQFLNTSNNAHLISDRPRADLRRIYSYTLEQQIQNLKQQNLLGPEDLSRLFAGITKLERATQALSKITPTTTRQSIRSLATSGLDLLEGWIIEDMQNGYFDYTADRHLLQEYQHLFSRKDLESWEQRLEFYLPFEKAKSSLRRAEFSLAMKGLDQAQERLTFLSHSDQVEKRQLIQNGKERALAGMLIKTMERPTSDRRVTYREIVKTIMQYNQIRINESARQKLESLEQRWFGSTCGDGYREYTRQILLAEIALENTNYKEALQHYKIAEPFERSLLNCGVQTDKVYEAVAYYELAVNFEDRQEALHHLLRKGDFEEFDQAHFSLWKLYQEYRIKEKFGYQMLPIWDFTRQETDTDLMRYLVSSRAADEYELENVRQGIQWLSYRSSKKGMQSLGTEVAKAQYPNYERSAYLPAFEELLSEGAHGMDKKNYKAFRKGYKKAWKVAWKKG